jgi:hypothetical protein
MWIIGQKIFSDKNILPIKTANIFGKQYFTNKHVLAGDLQFVYIFYCYVEFSSQEFARLKRFKQLPKFTCSGCELMFNMEETDTRTRTMQRPREFPVWQCHVLCYV